MRNHVYKSLVRPLTVAAVPFDWLVMEMFATGLVALWFGAPLLCIVAFLVMHLWAVYETKQDPQWVSLYLTRAKHLKKKARTKRYLA